MNHAKYGAELLDAANYAGARAPLKKALRKSPDDGVLMQQLGIAELMTGRVSSGLSLMIKGARALEAPDAWQRVAAYLHRAGRDDEAAKALMQALALDPRHLRALRDLAFMMPEGDLSEAQALFAPLKEVIEDASRQAFERALAHSALSRLSERCGAHEDAIDHALAAGALDGVSHAPTRAMAEAIAAAWQGVAPGSAPAVPAPVFIIGMPRSGTTLLERFLANHSALSGGGELDAGRLASRAGAEAVKAGLSSGAVISAAREAYLASLAGAGMSSQSRWIDKQPDNLFSAGLLARAFPGARFVWIRRLPLDCAVSCLLHRFSDPAYSYCNDQNTLAEALLAGEVMGSLWEETLPGGMISIRYEDLASDTENTLRSLCHSLDLPWQDAVLSRRRRGIIHTASAASARGPVTQDSIGRWRRYESRIGRLIDMLGVQDGISARVPLTV